MKRITSLLVCLTFMGMSLFAQDIQISGKVTSAEDGKVLPGVSVVVKGTTTGTTTNIDGEYSLSVPPGATLVYSFIGMKTQEVPVGTQTTINAIMEADITGLEEVVVTALGISRDKKSLGYAVQKVDAEELNRVKNENVVNSLSGKVAGLQIKNNTNMGGSSNIIIRGNSSLMGNNQALFIVDGVPVDNTVTNSADQRRGRSGYDYGNPVADINPDNIESVNVLKGAAATALYGSRAANGVIIITTKKGKKGNITVGINSTTMFSKMDKNTFPKYQENYGAGYGPYYSDSDYPGLYYYDLDGDKVKDYIVPSTEDASMGSRYDPNLLVYQWDAFYPESPTYMQKSPYVLGANGPEYFFKTGKLLTNSVNVSGGTTGSTFRLSYTNTSQEGMIPNSNLDKNNVTFNGSLDVFKKLKISSSANYTNSKAKGRNSTGYSDNIMSMFRQWYNLGVDMKKQDDYYNSTKKNLTWNPNSEDDLNPIYWDNPYWQRYENYQQDERNRLIGYVRADWEINSFLDFMARATIDNYSTLQEERKAVGSVSGEFGVGNPRPNATSGYSRYTIGFMETNFDAHLKFNKDIATDLNLTGLLGINIRRTTSDEVFNSTNGGLAVPGVYSLSNSVSPMLPPEESLQEIGINGYFGSVSLGYKRFLYLDGTYRYDISSTLPEGENGYGYYGISGGFIFSELVQASFMDLGKVRVSYAQVGNDAPWGSTKDSYVIQSPFDGNPLVRLAAGKANNNLKPEISNSFETGLETNFLLNRLGLDIAYYKTNTVNQIVPLETSRAIGYSSKFVNVGEIQNSGVEIALRGAPVEISDFRWDIILNWSQNKNKVVTLGGDVQNLQIESLQGGVTINAREGEAIGIIQGTDYVYHEGQKVIGADGYYKRSSTSDKVIGDINPDWNAGLTNSFRYKNFSLSFLIDMQMGGSIFSLDQWYGRATGLYAETDFINDLGNPVRTSYSDGGGIVLPGVVENADGTYSPNNTRVAGDDYRVFGYSRNPNAGFIWDATYVKLRELSFSYSLPDALLEKTPLTGATISILGSNLWILYKELPHADPEASQGAGNVQGWQSGVFPTAKNIGFSINLQF